MEGPSLDSWCEDFGYYDEKVTRMIDTSSAPRLQPHEGSHAGLARSAVKKMPPVFAAIFLLSVKVMAFSAGSGEEWITSFSPSCFAEGDKDSQVILHLNCWSWEGEKKVPSVYFVSGLTPCLWNNPCKLSPIAAATPSISKPKTWSVFKWLTS